MWLDIVNATILNFLPAVNFHNQESWSVHILNIFVAFYADDDNVSSVQPMLNVFK